MAMTAPSPLPLSLAPRGTTFPNAHMQKARGAASALPRCTTNAPLPSRSPMRLQNPFKSSDQSDRMVRRSHAAAGGAPLAHPRSRLRVCSVLKESVQLEMGTRAPEFSLLEPLSGNTLSLSDFEGHPALLVAFICNHCPYVIHIRDEFIRLSSEYITKEGLGVVAISSNSIITHPQDGPEFMAKDAKELHMPFPYLYDETQEVAKAYKAACTPDFYIFKKDGRRPFELAYHGQMDDSRPKTGKPVTGRDLRVALDAVLSARPVPANQKPSIGCNIKWTPGNEPGYF